MTARETSGGGAAALMDQIQRLLDDQRASEAFNVLGQSGQESPAVRNARGVCLMRMGKPDRAAKVFADLVFHGGVSIPDSTPTVFRTNYVTALLLENNPSIACELLKQIPERSHPAVARLEGALRRWKRSLPWWRRVLLAIGMNPGRPPHVDFAPGDLWVAETPDLDGPKKHAA